MTFLHPEDKRKGNYRMIGASLPTEIHSYLTLHALAKSITKSDILKKIINKWITEQKKYVTDEQLIIAIVSRVGLQWQDKKKEPGTVSFKRFKDDLHNELLTKGIDPALIQKILAKIER